MFKVEMSEHLKSSSSVFFHHRNYSTYEITSSSIHVLSTILSPFNHLLKFSLLSNLIDQYPHFLLIFIFSKKTPDHYFNNTSANNLNSRFLCLLITYLAKSPKPCVLPSLCLQTLLQKVSLQDRLHQDKVIIINLKWSLRSCTFQVNFQAQDYFKPSRRRHLHY